MDAVPEEVFMPCYIIGSALLLNFLFSLFMCSPIYDYDEPEELHNPLVGNWQAVLKYSVPANEHSIIITRTEINFVNGGGGFANGAYKLDKDGSCTKQQGKEQIKFMIEEN